MIGTVVNGQLILANDRIPCSVRRSPRARRMRMTLSAEGGLTVTVPYGTSRAEIDGFVRSCLPWIERTRLKLSLRQRRKPQPPPLFPQELVFPATGEHFPVRYEWRAVCWTGVREDAGTVLVSGRVLNAEQVRDALRQYLIRKAEQTVVPMLVALAAELGFRIGRVSVRFQRGRWGSCSRARDISLNAQLLFLQPEEVRYVLIHELCHTREMNHSARFWQEVARYCPDHLRLRASIRKTRPPFAFD
ncbi:MAG: M48 family metallopeptidase [Lentisphaeria bacterium]|nr:M48 family metallopeptidase [Lentisphaeria bacterium]